MTGVIQVKRGIAVAAMALLLLMAAPAVAQPPATEIVERVRLYQLSQEQSLSGRIRNKGDVISFDLEISGGVIRYHLKNPAETLTVRLSDGGSSVTGGGDLKEPVRGTDITLEDLSMKFLYWDRVETAGEESTLAGRPAWRVKVYAPSRGASSYGMVMLWVDQQSSALMRADAYGWDGKAAKRFQVRSIQRHGGGWLLKQMRIQSLEGTRSRDKSPTYLEIEAPE